jgi:hypothetical protein
MGTKASEPAVLRQNAGHINTALPQRAQLAAGCGRPRIVHFASST